MKHCMDKNSEIISFSDAVPSQKWKKEREAEGYQFISTDEHFGIDDLGAAELVDGAIVINKSKQNKMKKEKRLAQLQNVRAKQIPKLHDLLLAVYFKEKGDNSRLNSIVSTIDAVLSVHPLDPEE